jgi:hypothetical protein
MRVSSGRVLLLVRKKQILRCAQDDGAFFVGWETDPGCRDERWLEALIWPWLGFGAVALFGVGQGVGWVGIFDVDEVEAFGRDCGAAAAAVFGVE